MNKKQITVLTLEVIAIVLIVIFTPRYKITWLDSENFIKTEQTSPLYKRSKAKESLHLDKIAIYSGLVAMASGLLIFGLRDKRG
ncbi:MAG: hypothetical protein HZB36_01960 [Candidatus Omnitrophica bacterium]|jgi:hypothetical protein|nr:hypothetical protein [Candidatus Omnitrophota bacterium]